VTIEKLILIIQGGIVMPNFLEIGCIIAEISQFFAIDFSSDFSSKI